MRHRLSFVVVVDLYIYMLVIKKNKKKNKRKYKWAQTMRHLGPLPVIIPGPLRHDMASSVAIVVEAGRHGHAWWLDRVWCYGPGTVDTNIYSES